MFKSPRFWTAGGVSGQGRARPEMAWNEGQAQEHPSNGPAQDRKLTAKRAGGTDARPNPTCVRPCPPKCCATPTRARPPHRGPCHPATRMPQGAEPPNSTSALLRRTRRSRACMVGESVGEGGKSFEIGGPTDTGSPGLGRAISGVNLARPRHPAWTQHRRLRTRTCQVLLVRSKPQKLGRCAAGSQTPTCSERMQRRTHPFFWQALR